MQRRLALLMVIVVAGALAFAGVGSLLLVRHYTGTNDRNALREQANEIASIVDKAESNDARPVRGVLNDVKLIENVIAPFITNAYFLTISSGGTVRQITPTATGASTGPAPASITLDSADILALQNNEIVSELTTTSTTAIAPLDIATALQTYLNLSAGTVVAVALVAPVSLPGGAGLYFAIAAAISLVIAVVVAIFFADRIARPLSLAAGATGRIAAGDFDARLPITAGDYPELSRLAEAINQMAERLGRARQRERQFLLSISHDLRTPLTSIRGYAEAIADGATDDPAQAAAVITSEANRLDRLIKDLLDLARLDAHRFAIDVRRVDLAEVVAVAAEGLRLSLEDGKVDLVIDAPAGIIVGADPDRLSQVVSNLVENAGKHARARIRVAAGPSPADSGTAVLTVEDDGVGIPSTHLPHVFERFYTAAPAGRPRTEGSGLGLAIVGELVQAMGGSVRAESPLGPAGGTRLVVELRRWQEVTMPVSDR